MEVWDDSDCQQVDSLVSRNKLSLSSLRLNEAETDAALIYCRPHVDPSTPAQLPTIPSLRTKVVVVVE